VKIYFKYFSDLNFCIKIKFKPKNFIHFIPFSLQSSVFTQNPQKLSYLRTLGQVQHLYFTTNQKPLGF
jgi:hypothetical protein